MFLTSLTARGQQEMGLSEVIHTARNQSVEALEAKQAFISTYWHTAHIRQADCRHSICTATS